MTEKENLALVHKLKAAIKKKQHQCQIQQLALMQAQKTIAYLEKKRTRVEKEIAHTPSLLASEANEGNKIYGANSVHTGLKATFERTQDKLRHRLMLARKRLNVSLSRNEDLKKRINSFRQEKNIYRRAFASVNRRMAAIAREAAKWQNEINESQRKAKVMGTETSSILVKFEEKKKEMQKELDALELQCGDTEEIEKLTHETIEQEAELDLHKHPGRRQQKGKKLRNQINKIDFGELDETNWEMEELRYHNALWKRIQAATGTNDVDTLVNSFVKVENSRAHWVHEATSLVQQIQIAETKSRNLEVEKAKQLAEHAEAMKSWRQQQIKKIQKELSDHANIVESAEKNITEARRKYEEISVPICFLYRLLSNPEVQKELNDRMAEMQRMPAQFTQEVTQEAQALEKLSASIIRGHLIKQQKIKQFLKEQQRWPTGRSSSSRKLLDTDSEEEFTNEHEVAVMVAFLEQRINDLVCVAEEMAPKFGSDSPEQVLTDRKSISASGMLVEKIEAARIRVADMAVTPPLIETARPTRSKRRHNSRAHGPIEARMSHEQLREMAVASFAGVDMCAPVKRKKKDQESSLLYHSISFS